MPHSDAAGPEAERDRSRGSSTPVTGDARTEVTRVGKYEIHSREFGDGAKTLLLLHGLSGSSRWWARNIPELAARYRLLVPDLIGFGRSRTPSRVPDIDRLALLLVEWMDARGLGEITLVGHSMGGQIGIHLASRERDRLEKLVLIDSAGLPRPLAPGTLLRFAAEAGPLWRWGDPTFFRTIVGDAWTAGPRVLLRSIHHILQDDVRDLLPRIEVPTLIVWGERDTLVPLEHALDFRREIAHSRLVVLRGAGHNPMIDRPADFNRILIRFMENGEVGH